MIERSQGAIKIEQLWRELPADGVETTAMVEHFRQLYNTVRPHEMLHGARPIERARTGCFRTAPRHTVNAPSVQIP